jgi:hypothetical protein
VDIKKNKIMKHDFNRYITEVREQLVENATEEYSNNHTTYVYSNETVDLHLDYFKDCMVKGLSPYKSLLFFGDYLKNITFTDIEISGLPEKGREIVGLDELGNEYYCFRCNCVYESCDEWRDSLTGYGLSVDIKKWKYE